MSGPYEFGDIVDGHRWTVLGWEPVEGGEAAASAALQHAMGGRLERPAVTQRARHASPSIPEPSGGSDDVPPSPTGPAPTPGGAESSPVAAVPPEPVERVWTPVGWEVVERTDPGPAAGAEATAPVDQAPSWGPVEEFADVVAAAPSGPPVEAAEETPIAAGLLEEAPLTVDLGDGDTSSDAAAAPVAGPDEVLDLREPAVVRTVTLPEPAAGWYPD